MRISFSQLKRLLEESAGSPRLRYHVREDGDDGEETDNPQQNAEARPVSGQTQSLGSGSRKGPVGMSRNEPPTQPDSTARQRVHAVGHEFTPEELEKASECLHKLARLLGVEMDEEHHSIYYKNPVNGRVLTLRLANHSGSAHLFLVNGELTDNFGIVVRMNNKKFKRNNRVDYIEEIFFPSNLTPEREDAIAKGISDWLETGVYTGPKGDRTKQSVRTHDKDGTPLAQGQTKDADGQGRQEDAFSKGEEVEESFYVQHKGNKTMKKQNRIDENRKVTLTIGQLKKLVKESNDLDWRKQQFVIFLRNLATAFSAVNDWWCDDLTDLFDELKEKNDYPFLMSTNFEDCGIDDFCNDFIDAIYLGQKD